MGLEEEIIKNTFCELFLNLRLKPVSAKKTTYNGIPVYICTAFTPPLPDGNYCRLLERDGTVEINGEEHYICGYGGKPEAKKQKARAIA